MKIRRAVVAVVVGLTVYAFAPARVTAGPPSGVLYCLIAPGIVSEVWFGSGMVAANPGEAVRICREVWDGRPWSFSFF